MRLATLMRYSLPLPLPLLLLLALGCRSGSAPPPPPALGSFTLHWADANLNAPTGPGQTDGWLTGYTVTRDGATVANLGIGVTSFTDQTSVGQHTWQVFDSYQYNGDGSVTVNRLTVTGSAQ